MAHPVILGSRETPERDVIAVLQNVKRTRCLTLNTPIANNQLASVIPNKLRWLVLEGCIRLEQVLKFKAREIRIASPTDPLSDQEIYGFLKSWRAGKSHRHLKFLEIAILESKNIDEILGDIPNTAAEAGIILTREGNRIEGGRDITRVTDGVVATVYIEAKAPLAWWMGMFIANAAVREH